MAKLPSKLVQAPAFDSPLRRTTSSPALTVLDKTEVTEFPARESKSQITQPAPVETPEPTPDQTDELLHRVTVRLSQAQWEAVQTECFRLRMLGQKTNSSALIRDIVERWMARS